MTAPGRGWVKTIQQPLKMGQQLGISITPAQLGRVVPLCSPKALTFHTVSHRLFRSLDFHTASSRFRTVPAFQFRVVLTPLMDEGLNSGRVSPNEHSPI